MANQMSGPLRIDNRLGREARVDTNISGLPDNGVARAANQVASSFAEIGTRIGQMADQAAAREGEEAGRIAGLDPEFRPKANDTIYGDAFDRAGLDVAKTRLSQQVDAAFDDAFTKHANDPSGLNAALETQRMAILSGAPAPLKSDLELLMRGKKLAFTRQQARSVAAEMQSAAEGAAEVSLAEQLKGIHQRAYALGLDAQADEALAGDVKLLTSTLNRRGPSGKLLFTPEAVAKQLASVKETVATARISGAFSRLPTLDAKQQFLTELETDFAGSKGLAKVYDLPGFERLRNGLEADLRSAKTEAAAQVRAVKQDVDSVAKRAEKGFAPSSAEMAALKSRVTATGDGDIGQTLQVAENTIAWQSAARRATPAELDKYILDQRRAAQVNGATDDQVTRIELAEKLTNTARTELKQDPLGWADRVGLLKVVPLDISSPETATQSFKARMAQAEEVATYYGQKPLYLRPEEKRTLSTAASQGGKAMMTVAATLAQAAGDKAPDVLAEISDDAPVVAMLGGHVALAGATPAAQDVADGVALQRTEGFKPIAPSARDARTVAQSVSGGALSALPKAESAAIAMTNAAYEVRARRLGLTDFDEKVWGQAFRETLGERVIGGEAYGGIAYAGGGWVTSGHAVVVPPNVRQDGFDELVDALRMDDLVAASGAPLDRNDKPVSLTTVQRAQLVSVGNGKYWLAQGDVAGGDPQWIKSGAGDPYTLDLVALEPLLKKRRPDLYLGGQ